jgi:hypothetical protein
VSLRADLISMELQRSDGQPAFWPTCLAVFVAGWAGGLAVGFLWGLFGTYGATVELMRGFGATPRQGNLLEVIGLTLIGQGLLRAAVGALVLPRVLRWATGAEISWLASAIALAAGGLVSQGGWYALVRSGAPTAPTLSFVTMVLGFAVSVWVVRTAVAFGARSEAEPSRFGSVALLLGLPVVVVLAGWLLLSGFSQDDEGERLDRPGYQAASLEAEQAFAAGYARVETSGRTGPGFDTTTYGVQENLRDAASELERVGPPDDDLDEAHAELAAGLRAFADGLEALEEQPFGSDPGAVLPVVDGLEEIRTALLALRAAGYRVDPAALRLAG